MYFSHFRTTGVRNKKEKANPLKSGDAKLQGLKRVYRQASQLPEYDLLG